MALNLKVYRNVFAGGAVLAILIVSGFYVRGILKSRRELPKIAKAVASDLVQSTKDFTFSKSEGGHTLFTIHAAEARQFKDTGRAELHDVNIVVYGREANRFDQIYGADFEYDERTGDVAAKGEVHIDLESDAAGAKRPDQAPPAEMKNPIHLKTSGLTFNHKTGMAETKQPIEFRIPEAVGSAVGVTFDSHTGVLVMHSAVRITTTEKQKALITAQRATFTKDPRKAVLRSARVEQQQRALEADEITMLLRDDNTVDRVLAAGNVHLNETGAKPFDVTAPEAVLQMGPGQQVKSGTLSGGVKFSSSGTSPAQGTAGRVALTFGARNRVTKVRAEEEVRLIQSAPAKSMVLESQAADLYVVNGKFLEKAITTGTARIILTQGSTISTITAGEFTAWFDDQNRPNTLVGANGTKIVSSTPSQADQITTSRDLKATLDRAGSVTMVEQDGDFHFQQWPRTATAEHARMVQGDEIVTLTGSPQVTDSGLRLTAQTVQLNRKTDVALAQGNVKATFTELKGKPAGGGGGMLSSSDPIHVTGATMQASRNSETAKFTKARLWQGENMIEAPAITFDRAHRGLQAQGAPDGRVTTVFLENDKNGKTTPVNVTSDKFSYEDADRKALFSGRVQVRSADSNMTADSVQVLLLARGAQASSRLDRIVAQGDISIQQPNRKAVGSHAVYTALDGKFVLTGDPGKRPTISDTERGQVTGDSLTFYTRDDRVLVDSQESSHTLIQTRIRDASKN